MKKRLFILSICAILLSVILELSQTTQSLLAALKYGLLAYGIVVGSSIFMHSYIKKSNLIIGGCSILLIVLYTILLLDTFLFHTLPWFPGIIRYPLFSAYIPGYVLFVLVGMGTAFYPWNHKDCEEG